MSELMCPHCEKWLIPPGENDVRATTNPVAVAADCPECGNEYEFTKTEFNYYNSRRPDQVDAERPDRWMPPKFKRPFG